MKEKVSKTKKSKIPVPENQEALAKVKEVNGSLLQEKQIGSH